MIDFLVEMLKLLADVMATGAIVVAVLALAFEPLICGRRRR